MSKPKFPMTVQIGFTTAKVYYTPTNGCDSYTVVYYIGEKRVRKSFANLELAVTEANVVASRLSTGELDVVELRSQDRLAYMRAIEALRPTGVPLEVAALQFAAAWATLQGASLEEAAKFYAKMHPKNPTKKTVLNIVTELVQAKQADGMSSVYTDDLDSRLSRFGEFFTKPISELTTEHIEEFLRGLKSADGKRFLSARSRNNFRRAIGTLVYFAESRGYIVKNVVDVEGIARAKEQDTEIEIFTPEEMTRILEATDHDFVPFIAIGAFAGLRSAELERLDWAEVRLDEGFIEVKASKSKTASRRLVTIPDNLKLWLEPHKLPNGPVCPYANTPKQLLWIAEAVHKNWQSEEPKGQFKWKHNAMRHSFISYRLAQLQNVAQVSLEAGNSPQMVFKHYRELVRPADADKWFGITPEAVAALKAKREREAAAKIIPLESKAA